MKCAEHNDRSAICVCSNCGRGICDACRVEKEGKNLCATCARDAIAPEPSAHMPAYPLYSPYAAYSPGYYSFPYSAYPYPPYPQYSYPALTPMYGATWYRYKTDVSSPPRPMGKPTRVPFVFGAIGGIVLFFASLAFGVFTNMNINHITRFFDDYPFGLIYCTLFASVGYLLHGLGYFGYYRNYGKSAGLYTCALSMITAVVLPLSYITSISERMPEWDYQSYDQYGYQLNGGIAFGLIFAGLLGLFFGATLIQSRANTTTKGLHACAGVMHMIAGGMMMFVFPALAAFGWYVVAFAALLSTIALYKANLPTEYDIELAECISNASPPGAQTN